MQNASAATAASSATATGEYAAVMPVTPVVTPMQRIREDFDEWRECNRSILCKSSENYDRGYYKNPRYDNGLEENDCVSRCECICYSGLRVFGAVFFNIGVCIGVSLFGVVSIFCPCIARDKYCPTTTKKNQ
jgi:hypothetical protein